MEIPLIILTILNCCILIAIVLLIMRHDKKSDAPVLDSELLVKLGTLSSEISEKVNEKNALFSKDITKQLTDLTTGNRDSLDKINETLNNRFYTFQNDVFQKFDGLLMKVRTSLADNRSEVTTDIEKLKKEISENLHHINKTLEDKISMLQTSNEDKLEKMRNVVEEKLEKTLNDRLKLSFESVSKNLENVQKGLGEMQTLATDVGGLKKAITNVKTRGVFGEVQLGRILEEMFTPNQYERNAQVKPNKQERVEFAIKLPGKDSDILYLPIDSKFPIEDYEALRAAYEIGEKSIIDSARKVFVSKITTFAKDISSKYINPPITSDFAILFLPFESIYAEVVQVPGLFEELQRTHKIVITGPTTLSAFLNALQMGFKTLAIEKRSSEVWNILGAVKAEFKTFETTLTNVQKKIKSADDELSKLVTTRTNAMNRKLRSVDEIEASSAILLLQDDEIDE